MVDANDKEAAHLSPISQMLELAAYEAVPHAPVAPGGSKAKRPSPSDRPPDLGFYPACGAMIPSVFPQQRPPG